MRDAVRGAVRERGVAQCGTQCVAPRLPRDGGAHSEGDAHVEREEHSGGARGHTLVPVLRRGVVRACRTITHHQLLNGGVRTACVRRVVCVWYAYGVCTGFVRDLYGMRAVRVSDLYGGRTEAVRCA